jgi:ATP-dependent DNA helicase RecG
MSPEALKHIIQQGEGIQVEFKKASFELPKNVFQTVCSMLNRLGGHIFMGVNDHGEIEGVFEECVDDIKSAFVSSVNDVAQLNPKYYLSITEVMIDGKIVLYTFIPESSQVHSYLGKIYDRNEDGDFDISNNPDLVRQLHLKKQGSFSENIIYPAIAITDLRDDLIKRCRLLANNNRPGHPWMDMSDEEMLRSANLWKRDWKTGHEGYTLAGALLLGKNHVIQQILPHYKTDALLRREDVDRYDDREIVKTNLIESYDKLMAFIAKHLPDRFHLEGDQRVSLRDKIFREVIANTLIHREYMNEYPARLIISGTDVRIDNWNRPHGSGQLHLDSYSPFPKNPVLAAFFREIGRADELGSGYRNSERFTRLYSKGSLPVFEEGDIFRTIIPLKSEVGDSSNRVQEPVNVEVDGVNAEVDGVNAEVDGVNAEVDGVNLKIIGNVLDKAVKNINSETRENLYSLIIALIENEGNRIPYYRDKTKLGSMRTMERYFDRLKSADLVEFRGTSPKTGGYFITEKLRKQIEKESAD